MPKKFLIGNLACFGDCLFATTIAKQIKADYPNSHITWAVAKKYSSILQNNPHIDTIWELNITDNDFYYTNWNSFEKEALEKKANGEFDEIIFSQIPPLNWVNYNGTIRGTILSAYKKPITVDKSPVVVLSNQEIERVEKFAQENNLKSYKQVILFECAPGSLQSNINVEKALQIAEQITAIRKDVCFILSTPSKLQTTNIAIKDASVLSFRENAALTHYCTLLVGCSSGITWIATSTAAKKTPNIQLLMNRASIFAGIHYDFKKSNLNNTHVLEILDATEEKIVEVVQCFLIDGIDVAKQKHHQDYKPNYFYLKRVIKQLIYQRKSVAQIKNMIELYIANTDKFSINYLDLYYHLYIYPIKNSNNKIIKPVIQFLKKFKKE